MRPVCSLNFSSCQTSDVGVTSGSVGATRAAITGAIVGLATVGGAVKKKQRQNDQMNIGFLEIRERERERERERLERETETERERERERERETEMEREGEREICWLALWCSTAVQEGWHLRLHAVLSYYWPYKNNKHINRKPIADLILQKAAQKLMKWCNNCVPGEKK